MMVKEKFVEQTEEKNRFKFGKNWLNFLKFISDDRISIAKKSLTEMLEVENLEGKKVLDIGCGSGLFSLAATNLKARVHSFDYDIHSVECARYLKNKYHDSLNWSIEQGSILNKDYITSLGSFDIVYASGVLHHTGNLNLALSNAAIPVKPGGKLFLAIYNDQGEKSTRWLKIKKNYNSNPIGKILIVGFYFPYFILRGLASDLFRFKNPFQKYKEYKKERGMSILYDWHDWLGGLPFEVAKPEEIFEFYKDKGFVLKKLITRQGSGNNEFVFRKMETKANK